jgi:bifunctional NMN adenylyltransferase/nudix hydrolase
MIKAVFPEENVKVVPVSDYPYDDNKWVNAVQNVVHGAVKWSADPIKIALIGHEKDHTSFYLKIFPQWGSISVPNVDGINATDIRNALFTPNSKTFDYVRTLMSEQAYIVLEDIILSGINTWWKVLEEEYTRNNKYKKPYKKLSKDDIVGWLSDNSTDDLVELLTKFDKELRPQFPPTFMTVDSVVTQSGHILLVERGEMPGKGLWALPGGFLNQNETMLDGAIRELKEETKIKVPVPVLKGSIKSSKTFDAPNRSQRGRTITQAFFIDLGFDTSLPKVKGSDDAAKAFWVPFKDVKQEKMFEDHAHIIDYFIPIL